MANKFFLDSIQSPSPCSKDWDEMIGDERVRFCQSCEKNVYNLSAMTRPEARKFVTLNSGKVCVRYVRLPDGKIQTADTKFYKITRRASRLAVGMFGATLTLSAIADGQTPITPKTEVSKTVKSQNKNNLRETSQISFTVYDAARAVIPNAEVKLTNQKSKEEFIAYTNQDGVAYLSLIPRGEYFVQISSKDFRPFGLIIQIKERIEPNIKAYLQVGETVGVFIGFYEIPLFQAIAQEDHETVKNLINSGFKINTKDKEGRTALHVAVEHGNLEIVEFLLSHGANVNAKDKSKLTPIWMIEEEDSVVAIFKLLIEKGADINVPNEDKETLLMKACEDGNLEAVKILLAAGANPNLKDEDGETALQKTDSEEIKQLLKKYGARE